MTDESWYVRFRNEIEGIAENAATQVEQHPDVVTAVASGNGNGIIASILSIFLPAFLNHPAIATPLATPPAPAAAGAPGDAANTGAAAGSA